MRRLDKCPSELVRLETNTNLNGQQVPAENTRNFVPLCVVEYCDHCVSLRYFVSLCVVFGHDVRLCVIVCRCASMGSVKICIAVCNVCQASVRSARDRTRQPPHNKHIRTTTTTPPLSLSIVVYHCVSLCVIASLRATACHCVLLCLTVCYCRFLQFGVTSCDCACVSLSRTACNGVSLSVTVCHYVSLCITVCQV